MKDLGYFYRFRIDFDPDSKDPSPPTLSAQEAEVSVTAGLKSVFGELGASAPFDVQPTTDGGDGNGEWLLSCPPQLAQLVRAALTLTPAMHGRTCACVVTAEGRTLLDVALA